MQSATFSLDGSVLIIGCTTGHWFVMDAETREVYSMHTDGAEPIQVLATLFVSSEFLCNNSFLYNQHLLFITHYIALVHFSEHAFYPANVFLLQFMLIFVLAFHSARCLPLYILQNPNLLIHHHHKLCSLAET